MKLLKIWWSIIDNKEKCDIIVSDLEDISDKKEKVVITTGSWILTDIVLDKLSNVTDLRKNREQRYEIILNTRDSVSNAFSMISSVFELTEKVSDIAKIHQIAKIPIIQQGRIMKDNKPFKIEKWSNADCVSSYIANILWLREFYKLTNVDWIYKNFWIDETPLNSITSEELWRMWQTCVDLKLPELLRKFDQTCLVTNWIKWRIQEILDWKKFLHTKIIP